MSPASGDLQTLANNTGSRGQVAFMLGAQLDDPAPFILIIGGLHVRTVGSNQAA